MTVAVACAPSRAFKTVLGALFIVAGGLTLSGLDRPIKTRLEESLPDWLLSVATLV